MSTNISKQKREDLLNKIKELRTFISSAPQDENTGNLLSYLSDLEKDVNGKKYGLVFEEHREEIDEVLDTHAPVLTENKKLFIDNGGEMNFLIEGDNLAALKLLEKTHKGKIDLIYIDPPYNTKNADFMYDDAFVAMDDLYRHSKWLKVIYKYFEKKYHIESDCVKNKAKLEAHDHGYTFSNDIVEYTKSGSVAVLSKADIVGLNDISIHEPLNTHKHGKEYHHCTAEIGYKVGLDYSSMNTIIRKLFLNGLRCDLKILKLEIRELYAFVINNRHRLVEDVRDAMADESLQLTLDIPTITQKPIGFPHEIIFTYDGAAKSQMEYRKNVYKSYLSSAEKRSLPEKLFEKYCENSDKVSWFYKNGDKGNEYFSIVYTDNFKKQKSFYPDYIVSDTNNKLWIIETKGGFTKSGDSEDVDKYTAKKFGVLKAYMERHKLCGGIVRQDKQSSELCICTEEYSEDIQSDAWKLLSEVL